MWSQVSPLRSQVPRTLLIQCRVDGLVISIKKEVTSQHAVIKHSLSFPSLRESMVIIYFLISSPLSEK